jgi:nucleoside-diphosphate-sugar epimerase
MSSGKSKKGLVAVVGGTGRVGSSVVEALRQEGIPNDYRTGLMGLSVIRTTPQRSRS